MRVLHGFLLPVLCLADVADASGEGAVLLLVVGEGKSEAEEGGGPFADEDAPPVGAGNTGAGFGVQAEGPGGDGQADGHEGCGVGVFATEALLVQHLDHHASPWCVGVRALSLGSPGRRTLASGEPLADPAHALDALLLEHAELGVGPAVPAGFDAVDECPHGLVPGDGSLPFAGHVAAADVHVQERVPGTDTGLDSPVRHRRPMLHAALAFLLPPLRYSNGPGDKVQLQPEPRLQRAETGQVGRQIGHMFESSGVSAACHPGVMPEHHPQRYHLLLAIEGRPTMHGWWASRPTADRKFLGWIGDYGSTAGTRITLTDEDDERQLATWP